MYIFFGSELQLCVQLAGHHPICLYFCTLLSDVGPKAKLARQMDSFLKLFLVIINFHVFKGLHKLLQKTHPEDGYLKNPLSLK